MRNLALAFLLFAFQAAVPVLAQQQDTRSNTFDRIELSRKKLYPNNVLDTLPAYVRAQLIVSRTSGNYAENVAELRTFITELYNRYSVKIQPSDTVISIRTCGSCGDFELWDGEILQIIIDSAGERIQSGAKPRIVAQGVSPNFITNLPKANKWLQRWGKETSVTQQPYTGDPVKIAVFDTGLDTSLVKGFTQNMPNECFGGSSNGWNVGAGNGDYLDNSETRHGTVVTRLIIDEIQKAGASAPPIQIIPVKVLNANGQGTLFDFLCGLNYASRTGAKVINASLGFYYYYDSIPGFEEYIDSVLTENKIMLFAAAGNKQFNKIAYGAYAVAAEDIRNIDSNYFYPGGLSVRNKQLVCITTADKNGTSISSQQNYSSNRVNISVGADKGYCFKHPYKRLLFCSKYISGSSFATPVFTGKYISWKFSTGSSTVTQREPVLTQMVSEGLIESKPQLIPFIKNGNFIKR